MDPTDLHSQIRVVIHLRLPYRISSSRDGSALWRTQDGRGLASEVTFLYRKPEDDEGGQDGDLMDG
jgi:hypothetical protein